MPKSIIHFTLCLIMLASCKQQMTEMEAWKLGWRMEESAMNENMALANAQFDSLRQGSTKIAWQQIKTGLKIKHKLGKVGDIEAILQATDTSTLSNICGDKHLSTYQICQPFATEKVDNKDLQLELIKMFVEDQASRGNSMEELQVKYGVNPVAVVNTLEVDARNQSKLKGIIDTYGFPTKKLVGKEAMHGIFFIIQHSDDDKAWQQSQLANIEKAVQQGDLDGHDYAYLYDRIKVNSGKKQRYGTQFENVNATSNLYQLFETEDVANLDLRRQKIGLMPIEMYKRIHAKYTGVKVK